MYRIAKRFSFAAAHSLPSLPEDHKCHRLHGHNYVVEVELQAAALDRHGMVLDYGALGVFRDWLMATVDHRNLNDYMERFPDHREATAENLAYRLLHELDHNFAVPWVEAVRVKETDDTWAECRR